MTPMWHVNFPGLGFSMRVPGWRLKLQDCWCFMAALAAFFHVFSMDDFLFDFADQKAVRRLFDPSASESSDRVQRALCGKSKLNRHRFNAARLKESGKPFVLEAAMAKLKARC